MFIILYVQFTSTELSSRQDDEPTSENAHARTMCLCSNECSTSPVNASQTFLHTKITDVRNSSIMVFIFNSHTEKINKKESY